MLRNWLPFLIYGLMAIAIPASMVVMSFVFAQRPSRRTRARVRRAGFCAKTNDATIMDTGIAAAKTP